MAGLGRSALAVSFGHLLAGCGSEDGLQPVDVRYGEIDGTITDGNGVSESGRVGSGRMQVFLLYANGFQTGRLVEVDDAGRFGFSNVAPGSYQVRFWAGRYARVLDHLVQNPLRVAVEAGSVTEVTFPVERGIFDEDMIEIYVGDDFFQEQPFGERNSTTDVELGKVICWYNVGQHIHNVVSGDLFGSPDLKPTEAFIWKADRTGEFSYQCEYHLPQMRAILRVVG